MKMKADCILARDTKRGIAGLVHLEHWSWAQCFQHILPLRKMAGALLNLIRYLESNSDSMPNYGSRYRDRLRISTGFVESAVNEIIAKRMAKKQQMRWNRHTIQPFHLICCFFAMRFAII